MDREGIFCILKSVSHGNIGSGLMRLILPIIWGLCSCRSKRDA